MSFFKSLDDLHEDTEVYDQLKTNVTFSTVEYSYTSLIDKINDGSFSDSKIQTVIKYGIRDLLDYSNFEKAETRKTFQTLWTTPRFLKGFISIAMNDGAISDLLQKTYKYEVNKLCYDYMYSGGDKDPLITSLYQYLSQVFNAKESIPLTTLMNQSLAWQICVFRYSSFSEIECANRLNLALCLSGMDFSMKDIIYIYSRFFADDFSQLFCASMCLTDNNNYIKTANLDDNGKKVWDRISLSLLHILNSMTSTNIEAVLINYDSYLKLTSFNGELRFSMKGLSNDFDRVNKCIDNLLVKGVVVQ